MSAHAYRIEPIPEPDDGSEYGILDGDDEIAVVSGGMPIAQLFARSPLVLELLRQATELMPLGTAKRADWLSRTHTALRPLKNFQQTRRHQ